MAALWAACSDPPDLRVAVDPTPNDAALDAGRDGAAPWVRPEGDPILPAADSELSLPYGGEPRTHLITVEAGLGALDLHLSIDTSQSIAGEIDALQQDLQRRIVPEIEKRVADLAFGVSRFEDFPAAPFGFAGDERARADTPFELLTPITKSEGALEDAVAALDRPLGFGGDSAESGAEALWQIAAGAGYEHDGEQIVAPFDGDRAQFTPWRGGVGFREQSLAVVLHVTDAVSHGPEDYGSTFPDTHTIEEAADALAAIGAQVVGIVSAPCGLADDEPCDPSFSAPARGQLELVAHRTGALRVPDDSGGCPHGIDGTRMPPYRDSCPLVFDAARDGSGLADTLVEAIVELVDGIQFARIAASATDDPLGFVKEIRAVQLEQPAGRPEPTAIDLLPEDAPDGVPDGFVDVRSRARLGFEVRLQNDRIAPADRPQRFRLVLQVLGDGVIVEEQTLRVVIPAGGSPRLDAGAAVGGDPDDAGAEP